MSDSLESGLYIVGDNPLWRQALADLTGMVHETSERPPRLILVDSALPDASDIAAFYLKKRIPIVLGIPGENLWRHAKGLALLAQRNRVPIAVLGSLRWLPAVATAKEYLTCGCLGEKVSLSIRAAHSNSWAYARILDLQAWLGLEAEDIPQPDSDTLSLILRGENGHVEIRSTLDGQMAEAQVTLAGHSHLRIIPTGDPQRLELGILKHFLVDPDFASPSGKIKSLPLLMPLCPL